MRWDQPIQYALLSDVGFRRRNNEDACSVHIVSEKEQWERRGHIFLVADGMGGHAVGELASKIAVDTIPHMFLKSRGKGVTEALVEAVEAANQAIHIRGTQTIDFHRMGTTCAALVLCAQGALTAHVGDSRVYRVRGQQIDLLTADHSLQWELEQSGRLPPEYGILNDARHVITRSLGPEEKVEVEITGPHEVLPGDVFVLCSDGLTNHLSDQDIGIIARDLPPDEACRLLVHLANLRGGTDNITVIVVRVGGQTAEPGNVPAEEQNEELEIDSISNFRYLFAYWVLAAQFAAGFILLAALQRWVLGTGLVVLALAEALLVGILWSKEAKETAERLTQRKPSGPARSTHLQRMNKALLQQLGTLESDLRRTASEEEWAIDWKRHEQAYQAAREALSKGDFTQALRELGRAIDTLMVGVHEHRRQIVRAARWGKGSRKE